MALSIQSEYIGISNGEHLSTSKNHSTATDKI